MTFRFDSKNSFWQQFDNNFRNNHEVSRSVVKSCYLRIISGNRWF